MELSEGGSRMPGWELNNIARLLESHSQTKTYLEKSEHKLFTVYS